VERGETEQRSRAAKGKDYDKRERSLRGFCGDVLGGRAGKGRWPSRLRMSIRDFNRKEGEEELEPIGLSGTVRGERIVVANQAGHGLGDHVTICPEGGGIYF